MKTFKAENGETWVAGAAREETERHHGVWYLVFHREGATSDRLAVAEVRWQTRATAERTLRTMSDFELRRRLNSAIARHTPGLGPTEVEGEDTGARSRTNVNAG
jgi:hypothetical protein